MKWLRHRKALRDRDSGIVFAWRGMDGRVGGMLVAAVVVGVAATALASVVKVRVLSPPARSQRRGEVIVAVDDRFHNWMQMRGAELTPFPAALDVSGFEATAEALAAHPALRDDEPGTYVPATRPLPETAGGKRLPVGEAGRRVLPALPPLLPVDSGLPPERGYIPVLSPDSLDLAARVPVPLPEFGGRAIPFSGERRFLMAVAGDGGVRLAMPLEGPGDEAMPEVEGWLRRIRFEPVDSGEEDWFVVGVRFLTTDD